MKITDEAKEMLEVLLPQNKADGLYVIMQPSCHGVSPVFHLATFDENDVIEEVNGIKVVIPEEAKAATEEALIDVVQGNLAVLNVGCCGCSHDDHSCCHDHEEGHGCCHHQE